MFKRKSIQAQFLSLIVRGQVRFWELHGVSQLDQLPTQICGSGVWVEVKLQELLWTVCEILGLNSPLQWLVAPYQNTIRNPVVRAEGVFVRIKLQKCPAAIGLHGFCDTRKKRRVEATKDGKSNNNHQILTDISVYVEKLYRIQWGPYHMAAGTSSNTYRICDSKISKSNYCTLNNWEYNIESLLWESIANTSSDY